MAYGMSSVELPASRTDGLLELPETHLFELGLSHATGVGAEVDYVEAHKWFNIAALRGNCEAKLRRQELTAMMTQSQLSAAQRAAREWLLRSAN